MIKILKKIINYIFKDINSDEFIFDLTIAAFILITIFFYRQLILSPIELFTPEACYLVGCLIQIAVFTSLGKIYNAFLNEMQELPVLKAFIILIIGSVFFCQFLLFFGHMYSIPSNSSLIMIAIIPQFIFFSAFSFFIGWLHSKKDTECMQHIIAITITYAYSFLPLLFLGIIFKTHVIWVIFSTFGLLLVAGKFLSFDLPEAIWKSHKEKLSRIYTFITNGSYKRMFTIFFSVILALGILVFQDLILRNPLSISAGIQLFVSGLIPIRILWAFAPPRKPINIILGIIILILYIVQLFYT